MTGAVRTAGAVLVAVTLTLGIAALSRFPYAGADSDGAVLRLSWRTRGEEVRECRTLTAEELAKLPVHMRRSESCEGRVLPRHLRVELDGRIVLDDTLHAAGARGDRPLYVYHEIPLSVGVYQLAVRFASQGTDSSAVPDGAGAARDPATLELDTRVSLQAGDVALVTYDPDRRALVVRGPGESEVP